MAETEPALRCKVCRRGGPTTARSPDDAVGAFGASRWCVREVRRFQFAVMRVVRGMLERHLDRSVSNGQPALARGRVARQRCAGAH